MFLVCCSTISSLFDDEFGLSKAESDEGNLQESSTDIFAFIGSSTVTSREVEALEDAVHSSDDSTTTHSNRNGAHKVFEF